MKHLSPLFVSTSIAEARSWEDIPGVNTRDGFIPCNALPVVTGEAPPGGVTDEMKKRLRQTAQKYLRSWVPEFLTPYQDEAWTWGARRSGSLLWWACGSGKTLAAICWLAAKNPKEKQVVITRAPARRQWKREFFTYSTLEPMLLSGQTASGIPDQVDLVVLSWEIVPFWMEAIFEWSGRTPHVASERELAIVYDEIHKGKAWKRTEKYVDPFGNIRSRWADNRASACARLSLAATRRLGLTATPIRDRRMDLWAQSDLVEPTAWGNSWHYAHAYCDARSGQYGGLDTTGISNTDELKARLATLTHVVSYGAMSRHLPPKRRQLVYLGKGDQSRPAAFKRDLKRAAKQGRQALFEVKLLEASSRKRAWIASTAADAAEAGQKVTVFTGRRRDCEALAKTIGQKVRKLDIPLFTGHGGDSLAVRDEMVRAYAQREEACVFVGTTDAFGEAVDGLQNTDLVIFGLLPWTPGQVTQAEGRFSRHGSKRRVLILYTIAEGTVDEHVASLLLSKLEAVEETLDDPEAGGIAKTLSGEEDQESIIQSLLEMADSRFGEE